MKRLEKKILDYIVTKVNIKKEYLSDSDSDYRLLEELIQKEFFSSLSDIHHVEHDQKPDDIARNIYEVARRIAGKNFFKRIKIIKQQIDQRNRVQVLGTRYDSVDVFMTINGLFQRLKNTLLLMGIEEESLPKFGTIPNGKTGAYAFNLESASKEFLLFDSKFFMYCHFFSKAFVDFVDWKPAFMNKGRKGFSIEEFRFKLEANLDEDMFRFVDIFNCHCVEGVIQAVQPWWNSGIDEIILNDIRDDMELFVVAHEYGHVFFEHLSKSHSAIPIISSNTERAFENILNENQIRELEADSCGIYLVIETLKKEGLKELEENFLFVGIYLFFIAGSLESKLNHLLLYENMDNYQGGGGETHPPFEIRKLNVRLNVDKFIEKEEAREHYQFLLSILDMFEELLWYNLELRFKFLLLDLKGKLTEDKMKELIEEWVKNRPGKED